MELKGTRELFDTVKSSRTCSVLTVSRLGRFARVLGLFWAKNGCFWPKTAQIWEGTSRLGTPALGRQRLVFGYKVGFGKGTTWAPRWLE